MYYMSLSDRVLSLVIAIPIAVIICLLTPLKLLPMIAGMIGYQIVDYIIMKIRKLKPL